MLSKALLKSIRTIAVISFLSMALYMWPVTCKLSVSVEWNLRFPLWWQVRLPCWVKYSVNWFRAIFSNTLESKGSNERWVVSNVLVSKRKDTSRWVTELWHKICYYVLNQLWNNSLPFIGMAITKTDNHFSTSVYRQKTNKGLVLQTRAMLTILIDINDR